MQIFAAHRTQSHGAEYNNKTAKKELSLFANIFRCLPFLLGRQPVAQPLDPHSLVWVLVKEKRKKTLPDIGKLRPDSRYSANIRQRFFGHVLTGRRRRKKGEGGGGGNDDRDF